MERGTRIAGRFELQSRAGEGGMGTVWRAHDHARDTSVAVKLLREQDARHADRFAREARTLAELTHPGIVRYVDHGVTEDGATYMVMEWLAGEDLSERLIRGPLPVHECLVLAHRVADALAAAHARGIVHRDIKPANIYLRERQVDRAVLLDFGIARLTAATRQLTGTGMVVGTPGYMAPEQARGERHLEAAADVFALGCVLYECLTGEPAFVGEHVMAVLARILLDDPAPVRERRPDVPPALGALVSRMLSKDPAARPRDGAELAHELAVQAEQVGPAPVSAPAALTATEQRVFSVVLVGAPETAHATVASRPTTEGEEREWLELLEAAVGAHGGRLERIAGGGLLVLLSGTGAATDQAAQAARCALAMRALVSERAVALATGRGQFADRWPVGPVIDRAARMVTAPTSPEDRAPADADDAVPGVAIDDVTAGLLDPRFEVRSAPGRRSLITERDSLESARTLLGRPTSCVGRRRELQLLESALDECAEDGVARALLVTAPPGIGKSRLRHEFLQRVASRASRVEVLIARGDPMSAGSPFGLLSPALRRAARMRDGEALALRQQKLRTRLARHLQGDALSRVTEFLGELIGTPFSDARSVPLRTARQDPRVMGDQILRAWQDWLEAETTAGPVLLVLEDLHWGDLPSIKLVDGALRQLEHRPLMLLAMARPSVHEEFPELWSGRSLQELRLTDLTPRAAEELVREVLGADTPAATVQRIVAHAAGNAFFLEELIRSVAEGQAALPDSVLGMVESRLQALEPEARRVLRAASVFGETFWSAAVQALLGAELSAGAEPWLARLAEREFITRRVESRFPDTSEFVFRHALVREAAHAMLTDQDRALGHRLAAAWLERAGERDAVVLAGHFEGGGEPARAVPYWLRAALQAVEGSDLAAALARAERGIACGAAGATLGELRLLQSEAHCWLAAFAEARGAADAALANLPIGHDGRYRATQLGAWAARAQGDIEAFDRYFTTLAAPGPTGRWAPRQLIELMIAGPALDMLGRYEQSDALLAGCEQALADPAAHVPESHAYLLLYRAMRLNFRGGMRDAIAQLLEASAELEQLGRVRDALIHQQNAGYALAQMGRPAEAVQRLRGILDRARSMGLDQFVALSQQNLALALVYLGRHEEAAAILTRNVAELQEARSRSTARCSLVRALIGLGQHGEAVDEGRRALADGEALPPQAALACAALGAALVASGRGEEALAITARGMAVLETLGQIEEGESLLRLSHAEALRAVGREDEARAAMAHARARLLERAGGILDPALRADFLRQVPERARTLALAEQWLGAASPAPS